MKRMGMNIDGLFISGEQKSQLISYLSVDQPDSVLVINSVPFAAEMKGRFPYMNVIYRDMGLPNQDNLWSQISPQTWWSIYAEAASYGLVVHTNNEPAITKGMVDWEIECAKIAIQNKAKVVLCNFSVGTPETPNNNPLQYELLKPLFKLVCENPEYLFLGVHCYAATNWYAEFGGSTDHEKWVKDLNHTRPNLLGRFKRINDYCVLNFGSLPNIIITEWGFDTIHAYYNYQSTVPGFSNSHMGIGKSILAFQTWKGNLASWEQYAFIQLQSAWNALYKKEKNIKGVCFFCWGGQGVWKDYFDISQYPKLVEQLKLGDFSIEEQKEIRMTLGSELRQVQYIGSESLRFRSSPTTSASILFNLIKDQIGYEFTKSTVRMNGYDWKAFLFANPRNGNLELGWTTYAIQKSL